MVKRPQAEMEPTRPASSPKSSSAVEVPFSFPPHRKSHLKSDTYRTLLRIVSYCRQHPQLLQPPPRRLTTPPDDGGSNEPGQQDSGKEVGKHVESARPCNADYDNSVDVGGNTTAIGLEEKGTSCARSVIHELEDLSKWMDSGVGESNGGACLRDGAFDQVQKLLIGELEDVLKGNEENGCGNYCDVIPSLDENQGGGGLFLLPDKQQEQLEVLSGVVEEDRDVDLLEAGKGHCNQNISETIYLSPSRKRVTEILEPDKTFTRTSSLGVNCETQQKEMEPEKSACANGRIGSQNHRPKDAEIEEGEVSGEFGMNGGSLLTFFEVVAQKEKKADELPVFAGLGDKTNFRFDGKNGANIKDSGSTSFMVNPVDSSNSSRELKADEIVRNEMVSKRKVVVYEDPILAEDRSWGKKQKKDHGTKEQKKGLATNKQRKGSQRKLQKQGSGAKDQKKGIGAKDKEQKEGGVDQEQEEGDFAKKDVGCLTACSKPVDSSPEKSHLNVTGSVQISATEEVYSACCSLFVSK